MGGFQLAVCAIEAAAFGGEGALVIGGVAIPPLGKKKIFKF